MHRTRERSIFDFIKPGENRLEIDQIMGHVKRFSISISILKKGQLSILKFSQPIHKAQREKKNNKPAESSDAWRGREQKQNTQLSEVEQIMKPEGNNFICCGDI